MPPIDAPSLADASRPLRAAFARTRDVRFGASRRRWVLAALLVLAAFTGVGAGSASAAVSLRSSSVATGNDSIPICPWTINPAASPTKPAGTATGDLMIATVAGPNGTMTAPSGWTLLASDTSSGYLGIYYRVAQAGEPASYTWSINFLGCFPSESISAEIDTYTGNDRVSPLTTGNTSTGTAATINLPNATGLYTGGMRISMVASFGSGTSTATSTFQAGLTMANHAETTQGHATSVANAYAAQNAGATTSYTDTLSRTVAKWLAATYVINPVQPTQAVFTTDPVGGVPENTNLATQPVVSLEDAAGSVATSNTSNVTLAIASGPGAGVLSCTSGLTVAAVAGVATFSGCKITGTAAAGTYTLSATSGALTVDTSASFTITFGAASQLAFTTQPVGGVAEGVNLGTQPVVTVRDAYSNTVTSDSSSVTLAIASGPGSGVFGCTANPKAASSGVATFAGCQITGTAAAATYTLTATDGALGSATSSSFTINVGTATKVGFTTQPVGGVAEGVNLATQPVVAIQDAYGNTVTGNASSVTLAIASGPGTGTWACTTNPLAATAGVATFAGCKITGTAAAGSYTLTATDGALTSATSSSFTIIVGAATKLAFFTQPVGGVAEGVALSTQPVVSVQDAYSNIVTSDSSSVTLAIASGPGSGVLGCTANPKAASSGIATFAACQITGTAAAGSYTLTATDGALTSATSSSFTIVPGAAAKLAFTTQPVGGVAPSTALPTQPVVSVQDSYSNVVPGDTSSVTLSIATGPGGGTLWCSTNPKAAVAGVATFASCRIDGVSSTGTYSLRAVDGALTQATSSTFTIVAGSLTFTASSFTYNPVTLNGQNQTTNATFSLDVLDTTGNGAGWHVSASATGWSGGTGALTGTQSNSSQPATAVCDGGAGSCTTATPSGALSWPIALSSTPTVLYNATSGTGLGPQTLTVPMALPIAANTVASGSFSSTVTLSITSGP